VQPDHTRWQAEAIVQLGRQAQGLNPHTGLPNVALDHSGGGYSRPLDVTDQPSARQNFGPIFVQLVRWLFAIPLLILTIFFGAWIGLYREDASQIQSSPHGGLIGHAVEHAFAKYSLPPERAFSSGNDVATAMGAADLIGAMFKPSNLPRTKDAQAKSRLYLVHRNVSSYLCQIHPQCQAEVAARGAAYSEKLLEWSVDHLIAQHSLGNNDAVPTVCMLPLMTGRSQQSASNALKLCTRMSHLESPSPRALQMLAQMKSDLWFIAATRWNVDPKQVLDSWARSLAMH